MSKVTAISPTSNDASDIISLIEPYTVSVSIEGTADLLFHRWNCDGIAEKAKAAKGSAAKKSDDIETFVYRDGYGNICLPTEYLRQSIIHAAKFKQDPRSPRKSAMDLFKAGVVPITDLASLGAKEWDYEHRGRVMVQRSGITRIRPAMKKGWRATFEFAIALPEYIDQQLFHEVVTNAGRLIGVGDFRPTFGRFLVNKYKVITY